MDEVFSNLPPRSYFCKFNGFPLEFYVKVIN